MAARKNRDQILILVKMMYSSQGGNLPCFKAGIDIKLRVKLIYIL